MREIPRLSWLGAKTAPQSNGGRKNKSGYAEEHQAAHFDNLLYNRTKESELKEAALEEKNLEGAGL